MNTFHNDLTLGRTYEQKLIECLELKEYDEVEVAPPRRFSDWDVKIISGAKETTYEVKADRLASRTGNLVVEYRCSGRPSGISTSKSDYYAYFIIDSTEKLYIIPTTHLRQYVKDNPVRMVRGGDGGRSEMYIIPLSKMEEFKIF